MQHYIKKYFWVSGVLVVMVSAVLAADGVGHYIEGKYLTDEAQPARVERPQPRAPAARTEARSKVGEPLAARNMFCSDCEPPAPDEPDEIPDADPDHVPLTSLPLELLATNVAGNSRFSFATIRNSSSQNQGSYWVEDVIPGAGTVRSISGKFVEFDNTQTRRRERIALLDDGAPPPRRPTPAARPAPRGPQGELQSQLDEGIKKIDDNNYEISRSLVDQVLANPMSVAAGARIVPSIKNGQANGFKLYAIRPSSVYAKIGMMNGDTIHSINGFDLTTPDKALEVYTKVRSANNLSVSVTRRGRSMDINYTIR